MFYDPPPEFLQRHPGRPYDAEIAFVDREIGRLLEGLGGRDDVLVVVTADHGESLGEHGEPQHGFLLYQSTLHVPLIASGPGVPRGLRRGDTVSLVDLEPTLRACFGLPAPALPRDGRALAWDREEPARVHYAETLRPLLSHGWSPVRALRSGAWKRIVAPEGELYDLASDPAEERDLGNRGPAADLDRQLAVLAGADDPEAVLRAAQGRPEPGRSELLRGFGYLSGPSRPEPGRPSPRAMLPKWLDRQTAKSLAKRAVLHIHENESAAAIPLLDEAVRLDPDLADAWYLGGLARLRTGNEAGARNAFEACAALDPRHVGAATELARMAEAKGRFDVAYEQWNHVAEVRPDSASLRYRLGILAERLGRHDEAIENFEAVVREAPGTREAEEAARVIRMMEAQ